MNLQDRIMEFLLTALDRVLNALSKGLWERWNQSRTKRKWGLG